MSRAIEALSLNFNIKLVPSLSEIFRLLPEVGNRQQATGNRGRDFKEKRAKKDFTSDFCKRSFAYSYLLALSLKLPFIG
ncbi:MAG: hypothetical protein SXA11_16210 [Cyanobacteriota bacterium]|nr:hypothetical protein [Cyanobacteriota bacterium]